MSWAGNRDTLAQKMLTGIKMAWSAHPSPPMTKPKDTADRSKTKRIIKWHLISLFSKWHTQKPGFESQDLQGTDCSSPCQWIEQLYCTRSSTLSTDSLLLFHLWTVTYWMQPRSTGLHPDDLSHYNETKGWLLALARSIHSSGNTTVTPT